MAAALINFVGGINNNTNNNRDIFILFYFMNTAAQTDMHPITGQEIYK